MTSDVVELEEEVREVGDIEVLASITIAATLIAFVIVAIFWGMLPTSVTWQEWIPEDQVGVIIPVDQLTAEGSTTNLSVSSHWDNAYVLCGSGLCDVRVPVEVAGIEQPIPFKINPDFASGMTRDLYDYSLGDLDGNEFDVTATKVPLVSDVTFSMWIFATIGIWVFLFLISAFIVAVRPI